LLGRADPVAPSMLAFANNAKLPAQPNHYRFASLSGMICSNGTGLIEI
jgi:hypothetical protein